MEKFVSELQPGDIITGFTLSNTAETITNPVVKDCMIVLSDQSQNFDKAKVRIYFESKDGKSHYILLWGDEKVIVK